MLPVDNLSLSFDLIRSNITLDLKSIKKNKNELPYMNQVTKICTNCKEELPATLECFTKHNRRKDGLRGWCKDCAKKYRKRYREANKKKIKEYNKGYREANKGKIRKYNNNYIKERRREDPQYHFKCAFSNLIRRALKKKGSSKRGYSWEKIIGYTTQDLMKHLEKQFTEGMTWDNYGKWHVDHIKPQSAFNFLSYKDKEFQECWALINLQPLWAKDNIIKSNKII